MLAEALKANSRLDTREGSLVWLGSAPAAVELQNLYIALQSVLDETFADTASRDYLILRAKERGISPLPATPAVLEMEATPKTLDIPLGTRFSIGSLNYSVTKNSGGGKFGLTCETAGEAGNDYSGDIIPIEYVAGLEACKVTALLVPGEDEEDTEIFRKRYLDSLNSQAFGGRGAPAGKVKVCHQAAVSSVHIKHTASRKVTNNQRDLPKAKSTEETRTRAETSESHETNAAMYECRVAPCSRRSDTS